MQENGNKTHHKCCMELFRKAYKEKILYVHLDEIEGNDIRFSIITDEMLKYDREGLELDDYRPYFFSFLTECKEIVQEYGKSYNEGEDIWLEATFDTKNTKDPGNIIYSLDGSVEYSASPVRYVKRHLKIVSKSIPYAKREEINRTYYTRMTVKCDKCVEDEFHALFKNANIQRARVYKVGHGNLIKLRGKKDNVYFNFFYDVGFHRRSHAGTKRSIYRGARQAIRIAKPDAVILSHWDSDHIMGIVGAPSDYFGVLWFAPDVKGCGVNALRLARFLDYKNQLILVDKQKNSRIVASKATNSNLELYMGKNQCIDGISQHNCSGLSLVVTHSNQKSILCGDVPYDALDVCFSKVEYESIVIPHHARKMNTTKVIKKTGTKGTAVYCNNNPGDTNHIDDLKKKNYDVLCTENFAKNYCDIKFR